MIFKFKKPAIALEGQEDKKTKGTPSVPSDLYSTCSACKGMMLTQDLKDNCFVCPKCGAHLRISARTRILSVADENTFKETNAELLSVNILNFPGYDEKLEKAKNASRENESVITGICLAGGFATAIFALEPDFMMGSMGSVTGEKITRLFETATKERLPVIGFSVSGGARIQEGILSLMQMAKTSAAAKLHSDAGLLYISVLTNPTTGGVMASFAMEGDIILAEPKALIGFAGPRVIEQTMRQKLPEGFQRAEFLQDKGFVDAIVHRRNLKQTLVSLLDMHQRRAKL